MPNIPPSPYLIQLQVYEIPPLPLPQEICLLTRRGQVVEDFCGHIVFDILDILDILKRCHILSLIFLIFYMYILKHCHMAARRICFSRQRHNWPKAPAAAHQPPDMHTNKHRKNCECCPVSQFIVRSQRLSWIQVLDFVGHFMSSQHSEQMSQRSQVSGVTL